MKRAETATADDVRTVRLFIADDWAAGDAPAVTLTGPATGAPIARVEQASRADVDRAVAAAQREVERLVRMTVFQRAALCHRVADLLLERKEEIASDLSLEQGKPYRSEAVPEVEVAAGMFRDAAECARRLDGAVIPSADPAKRVLTLRQARGVYGIITPWNYPVAIPSEYLGPGLATGNAMVWKPSEWTPLSAWHLMRCIADAGAPAGALSLLQGAPQEIGDAVVSHPQVVAIGLTGSSRTGQIVAQRAAGKPMLLELGGNGPTIVFDDADLERAVARTAYGCFANAGQICNSTERILVQRPVHDDVVSGLVDEARRVRLGSPFEDDTTMGPLCSEPTAAKVDDHLRDAIAGGGQVVFGGTRAEGFPTRLYYQPTVIDGVQPTMKLNLEETFGPVAPLLEFQDEEEALALANATPLGLQGSVFTRDLTKALRVAERLQTGLVNINETSAYWQPHTPTGGFDGKRSGIGRIGGMYTLLEMTQLKTINLDLTS
jgi:acyl-CoA reductase-like NAD-dependent aldehyde dehydrogenase